MGILDRAKEVASRKKGEAEAAIEKEKGYHAYAHPQANYVLTGKKRVENEEYGDRYIKERIRGAQRKAAVKEKARHVAGKVSGAARKFGSDVVRDTMQPAPRQPDMFGFGGSGKQSHPLDMGFGGKAINPLGSKRGKQIRIW